MNSAPFSAEIWWIQPLFVLPVSVSRSQLSPLSLQDLLFFPILHKEKQTDPSPDIVLWFYKYKLPWGVEVFPIFAWAALKFQGAREMTVNKSWTGHRAAQKGAQSVQILRFYLSRFSDIIQSFNLTEARIGELNHPSLLSLAPFPLVILQINPTNSAFLQEIWIITIYCSNGFILPSKIPSVLEPELPREATKIFGCSLLHSWDFFCWLEFSRKTHFL